MLLFSICRYIFFFFFIIVYTCIGQIAVFLVSVARNQLRDELELRKNVNRGCFRIANYDIAIVNFDLNFYNCFYLAFYCFKLNYGHCF